MRYWLQRLYKECTAKLYSFLVIDSTLASDNPLHFRKNLFERIWKLILTIDKIRDEKVQYDIDRDAAKISALSSGKNGLIGISYTRGNIKFKYSPLGKASEKQTRKQVDASKVFKFF